MDPSLSVVSPGGQSGAIGLHMGCAILEQRASVCVTGTRGRHT